MPKAKFNQQSNKILMESEEGEELTNKKANGTPVQQKRTAKCWLVKRVFLTLICMAVIILGLTSLIIAAKALKIHHKVLHGVAKTDKKLEDQQQADIKVLSEITISLDSVSHEMEKSAQQILEQFSDDETAFNNLKRRLDNLLRDMKQSSHEVMEFVMEAIQETDVKMKIDVNGQTDILEEIYGMLGEHKTKIQLIHDNVNKVHSHHQEHTNAISKLRVNTMEQRNILKNMSYQINSNWTDNHWDDLIGITTPSPIKSNTVRLNHERVEVLHNGIWGSVCDDKFGAGEAKVICRMLGFATFERWWSDYGLYGQIWLDEVVCTGNEANISLCRHNPWGVNDCDHTEDVYIKCRVSTLYDSTECDSGWKKFDGRCYFFHACTGYDYHCSANDAATACKNKGALLTQVRSPAHQAFIRRFLPGKDIFVGGHETRGVWRWADGELMANGYTHWGDGVHERRGRTNCMYVSPSSRRWHGIQCDRKYGDSYVCEI